MEAEAFYHIYNRGNNKAPIFFNRDNYIFFLRKVRKYFLAELDVLAYCLMPNHFHFLVYTRADFERKKYSDSLKIMLRSYTRAINKQENRSGSLFQQNTKMKLLKSNTHGMTQSHAMSHKYQQIGDPFICFHYIHQNPVRAGLVSSMGNWEFSSYKDYAGLRDGTLCNKKITNDLLEVPEASMNFIQQSEKVVLD